MTVLNWVELGVSVYLGVSFLIAAFKRAEDMNNNVKTYTKEYFVGMLWPLLVFFIPGYLVDLTAKQIAKGMSWNDKRVHAKKFNKVS
jgi:hypothetical protein